MIEIAGRLKNDTQNVQHKIAALEGESSSMSDVIMTLENLGSQINTPKAPGAQAPQQVEIVTQHNMVQAVRDYAGDVLKPSARRTTV